MPEILFGLGLLALLGAAGVLVFGLFRPGRRKAWAKRAGLVAVAAVVAVVGAGGWEATLTAERESAERLAADSAAAKAAGYSSVEDYRAAVAGGFASPAQLTEARALGLETADALASWTADAAEAEALGFADVPTFRAARAAGFADPERWALAEEHGASSPAELDAALAAEAERLEAVRAAEAGFGDDVAAWRQAQAEGFSSKAELDAHEEAECRGDLRCWGDRHLIDADVYCKAEIERLARYDVEWDTGFLTRRFDRFRWPSDESYPEGSIRYIGDRAKFQNGFGAWANVVYVCDFDPATKAVLYVEAREGRLPR